MFQLTQLPEALFLVILDFLERIDATQAFSICKRSYQLCKPFRQCIVRFDKSSTTLFTTAIQRIKSIISQPMNQLACYIHNALPYDFNDQEFPFNEMKKLVCSLSHFWHLCHHVDGLKVSQLELHVDSEYSEEDKDTELQIKVLDYLTEHFQNLELTELTFLGRTASSQLMIPFLHSLKSLTVTVVPPPASTIMLPKEYLSRLRVLKLAGDSNLSPADILLLNNIYDLEITNNSQLTDLSGLNRNYRVAINFCSNITDFSNCFGESLAITISTKPPFSLHFDFLHWKKVQRLLLVSQPVMGATDDGHTVTFKNNHKAFPKSLKWCELRGMFTQLVDWRFSLPRGLREFSLVGSNYFASIEESELGRIPVVTISTCGRLTSIVGLGEKNRSVTMFNCPKVLEITPLQNVPAVVVDGNDMFMNLRDVSVLTHTKHIIYRLIDFPSNFPFQNLVGVEILDIRFCRVLMHFHPRLGQVKCLQINSGHLPTLLKYMKDEGGSLSNQKIEIMVETPFSGPSFNKGKFHETVKAFYEEYLAKEYHFSIVYRPGNESYIFVRN